MDIPPREPAKVKRYNHVVRQTHLGGGAVDMEIVECVSAQDYAALVAQRDAALAVVEWIKTLAQCEGGPILYEMTTPHESMDWDDVLERVNEALARAGAG